MPKKGTFFQNCGFLWVFQMGFFAEAGPVQIFVSNHVSVFSLQCALKNCNISSLSLRCLVVSLWIQLSACSMLSISKLVNYLIIVDQFRMWCITLEKDQQKWLGHDDCGLLFLWAVDTRWYGIPVRRCSKLWDIRWLSTSLSLSLFLKSLCVWEMSAVLTENSRCCGFSGVYNLNHDVLKYSSTTSLSSQTK